MQDWPIRAAVVSATAMHSPMVSFVHPILKVYHSALLIRRGGLSERAIFTRVRRSCGCVEQVRLTTVFPVDNTIGPNSSILLSPTLSVDKDYSVAPNPYTACPHGQ